MTIEVDEKGVVIATVNQKELESIIVEFIARESQTKPPFIHTITKDMKKVTLTVKLEPVANVYQLPVRAAGPKKRPPRKT